MLQVAVPAMAFTSIVAIYFLFFAFSAFVLLPFGVQTDEEAGTPKVPGQAESAPHRFDLKRHLLKAVDSRRAAVRDLLCELDVRLDHAGRSRSLSQPQAASGALSIACASAA